PTTPSRCQRLPSCRLQSRSHDKGRDGSSRLRKPVRGYRHPRADAATAVAAELDCGVEEFLILSPVSRDCGACDLPGSHMFLSVCHRAKSPSGTTTPTWNDISGV